MSSSSDADWQENRAGFESRGRIAAQPLPGAGCEAGAAAPRLVARGESNSPRLDRSHPYAAITDYLTVTFPFPGGERGIAPFFGGFCAVAGTALGGLEERKSGLLGFKRSFGFQHRGAMFAYGGQNGRALLSLPGEACATIPNWADLAEFLSKTLGARITRWDGAVDDLTGTRGVDDAVRWYLEGGFTTGGNRPSCRQEGNWLTPDTLGRTFYVGKRKNGKLMRVYEKGKQLGNPASPWVRFELELHAKDREIPFDVLLRPGQYVAGAYPCMAWVRDEAFRIRTAQNQKRISYAAAVHWARNSLGQLVNSMREVEGSAEAVLEKLRRPGIPQRLDLPTVPPGEGLRR